MVYVISDDATSWSLCDRDQVPESIGNPRIFYSDPDSNPFIERVGGVYHYRGKSLVKPIKDRRTAEEYEEAKYLKYRLWVKTVLSSYVHKDDIPALMKSPMIKAYYETGADCATAASGATRWFKEDQGRPVKYLSLFEYPR